MQERRQFSRLPVSTDVRCHLTSTAGSEALMACSRDLSAGGIGVVLQRRHDIGTLLDITFRLPGSGKIMASQGRIAWVDEFTVGPDKAFDTGIQFTDLDEQTVSLLDSELTEARA